MITKGNFRGTVIDGAVNVTKNGYAQAVIKLHADEMYDEDEKVWAPWDEFDWEPNEIDEREAIVYACIFGSKGATFVVDDLKKIFSWDDGNLATLDNLMTEGVKIQWSNAMDTYNNATSMKPDGIKAYDDAPGGSLKQLDAKAMAELQAKFAGILKSETKPEPAAAGKRRSRKAAAKVEAPAEEAPVEEVKTEEPKADKPKAKRAARGSKKKAAATAPPAEAPAPPADPPEEEASVAEQADGVFAGNGPCTKAEAWADINNAKGEAVTDGEVSTAWMEAIQNVGDGKKQKELSDEEWGSVRAAVIDVVAVF